MVYDTVARPTVDNMDAPMPSGLVSLPALAAALRRAGAIDAFAPPVNELNPARLTPMYRIAPTSPEPAAEATAAAHVLGTVGDRLRRLTAAYGEWADFDTSAYFDLAPGETGQLLYLNERVTSAHLTFFADRLLPSFQNAARYFTTCFQPAYLQMQAHLARRAHLDIILAGAGEGDGEPPGDSSDDAQDPAQHFFDEIQPAMIIHWQRVLAVALHTRRLLSDDPAFWALNAANDERLRRRASWEVRPASGLVTALMPRLIDVPTLTLSIDFPLPAFRQPGRVRRLRRGRAHHARLHNRPFHRRDSE